MAGETIGKGVNGLNGFDQKAARERIEELKLMYRRLRHVMEPNGTWDWFLIREINELELALTFEKRKTA